MKKKLIWIVVLACVGISMCGCSKEENKSHASDVDTAYNSKELKEEVSEDLSENTDAEDETVMSGSDIFTEDIYNQISSIEYAYADERLTITAEEDIKAIYDMLAGLDMNNYKLTATTIKGGYSMFDIVTPDKTITVGLLAGDIIVDEQSYKISQDIVEDVRNIALKYKSE